MTDTFRKQYSNNEELKEFADEIKSLAEGLEAHINLIGRSREVSLALTNLEQAVMWATKAIYVHGANNG